MSAQRILFIHDDPELTKLYREKLSAGGLTVEVCKRFDLARQICVGEQKPGAILLDLVIQSGKTEEFITSIKQSPTTSDIPILVLPSVLTQAAKEAMLDGANRIIH